MRIAEQRGGCLFQLRPDVIPQGWQTDEEISLWVAYYERRAKESGH
jgi:hypothetical protein